MVSGVAGCAKKFGIAHGSNMTFVDMIIILGVLIVGTLWLLHGFEDIE